MKAGQIIYTSCRHGIEGYNSGFQNYSYSPDVKQWSNNGNSFGMMQLYQIPQCPGLPPLPTRQEAADLYPRRQCFAPIQGTDALYGMAVCSYIGRDYPEGSVRGGNFISHVAMLPQDKVHDYPIRYCGSPSFMTWMDPEVARRDETPALLDSLSMEANPEITRKAVQEFLEDEDNADTVREMLKCLIGRKGPNSGRRILIEESESQFLMWVACLQYALPIRQSLGYGFSTYEYSVVNSPCLIVRAIEGMEQSLSSLRNGTYLYFAPAEGVVAALPEDERLESFVDFLLTMLRYSPEGLQSFHDFLNESSYCFVDRTLVAAHAAYGMVVSGELPETCDPENVRTALQFLQTYGTSRQRSMIQPALLGAISVQLLDGAMLEAITKYEMALRNSDASLFEEARPRLVQELVALLRDPEASQELYDQLRSVTAQLYATDGQNADAVLFAALTSETSDAFDVTVAPWAARPYLSLVTAALMQHLSIGNALPGGVTGYQMAQSLGPTLCVAVRNFAQSIAAEHDSAAAATSFRELLTQWEAYPQAVFMLDLLVLETNPTATAERLVADHIKQLFLASTPEGRLQMCRSMAANGHRDWNRHLIDFLAQKVDPCRGDQEEEAISQISTLCSQLSLPIPDTVQLAQHQDILARLEESLRRKSCDDSTVSVLLSAIRQQGPILPFESLRDKDGYLNALAGPLSNCLTVSKAVVNVQQFVVPANVVPDFMAIVFTEYARRSAPQDILLALACDVRLMSVPSAPASGMNSARYVPVLAHGLVDASVRLTSLTKITSDEKKMTKLVKTYEQLIGSAFPRQAFEEWTESLYSYMEGEEQPENLFSRLKRGFGKRF